MSEERWTIFLCPECGFAYRPGDEQRANREASWENCTGPPSPAGHPPLHRPRPFEEIEVVPATPLPREYPRPSDDEVAFKAAIERSMGFRVGKHLAYRGKAGCTNSHCTIGPGYPESCYGWHCANCDEPCSMMGHECEVAP